MTATQEQRISDLESATFRIGHRLDRLAATTEHLTDAVGDLSQGQRALALDVTEIRQELSQVRTVVERIERRHGEQLDAQGAILQSHSDQLHAQGEQLRVQGETLGAHTDMLRAILERLDGTR
jgi:chromosome segregation ATPase